MRARHDPEARLTQIDDFDWHLVANGGAQHPMRVGRLASAYCRIMECSSENVLFDPAYAPKLRFKHGLTDRHLRLMPITMRFGTAVITKPYTMSFFYADRHLHDCIFHLAIKTTTRRHELWVVTFHRIAPSDVKRRMRKGLVVWHQA